MFSDSKYLRARFFRVLAGAALLLGAGHQAAAHHSFAVYDFSKQIQFDGVVETLNFKNPHIAMTLRVVDDNGQEKIIDFIEGAPANMLVRKGLRPEMVKAGTHVIATGSPLMDDPTKFFLRRVKLDDGREFE